MSTSRPWEPFGIEVPDPDDESGEARAFDSVYHVAHVPSSMRILEDRQIRAQLVSNVPILGESRAPVVWLSPNEWRNHGSIYGTQCYRFPWANILGESKLFWVHASDTPRQKLLRFLIARGTAPVCSELTPYDPTKDFGPIRASSSSWYFLSGNREGKTAVIELMLLDDLALDSCDGMEFWPHRQKICSKHGSSCDEQGLNPHESGAFTLAHVMSDATAYPSNLPIPIAAIVDKNRKFAFHFSSPWWALERAFVKCADSGRPAKRGDVQSLLRAALLAYSKRDTDMMAALLRQVGGEDEIRKVLRSRATDVFGELTWEG